MSAWLIPAAQGLLAVSMLLVAVLCIRLDRKLDALRKGKDGVAKAAGELALAVEKAETSVRALKTVSEAAAADLQAQVEAARATAETLKFLSTTARAVQDGPAREPQEAGRAEGLRSAARRGDIVQDEDERFVARAALRRTPPGGERWGGLR
jgi:Domain of unknown function (DUF6468)